MKTRRLLLITIYLGNLFTTAISEESPLVHVLTALSVAPLGPFAQNAGSPDITDTYSKGPCASTLAVGQMRCADMEKRILDSVVVLEYSVAGDKNDAGRQKRISHGTVKDGRYLVVHNHFAAPIEVPSVRNEPVTVTMTLYRANGKRLYSYTGDAQITVAAREQEALVLDFGARDNGQGFFEWLRVPSASFRSWKDVPLEPGDEVAQIDYDGENTFITWTTIEAVITDDGVPRIVVGNGLSTGASGGGVFWKGYHVANNWGNIQVVGETSRVHVKASIAALNPSTWPMRLASR